MAVAEIQPHFAPVGIPGAEAHFVGVVLHEVGIEQYAQSVAAFDACIQPDLPVKCTENQSTENEEEELPFHVLFVLVNVGIDALAGESAA